MELNPANVKAPSNTPAPKPENVVCFTLLGLIAGLIIGLLAGILIRIIPYMFELFSSRTSSSRPVFACILHTCICLVIIDLQTIFYYSHCVWCILHTCVVSFRCLW